MDCMRVSTGCPARCHLRNECEHTQFNVPTTMQKLSNVWVCFVVSSFPQCRPRYSKMSRQCPGYVVTGNLRGCFESLIGRLYFAGSIRPMLGLCVFWVIL